MLETFSSFPVTLASSFPLIGLAEIGDKSQLVCIALAVRYRAR
ncbi:MAG: TMEM165/GDT1 family protein [Porticoccus sp.]|nr:TMEM165/GDT1 family protein [Porticoccus sp.]